MNRLFLLVTLISLASCKHSQSGETSSKSIDSESCKLCSMTSNELAQTYHTGLAAIHSEQSSAVERRLKFIVGAMPGDHIPRYIRSIDFNYGGDSEDLRNTAQFLFQISSEAKKLGANYQNDIDNLMKLDPANQQALDFDQVSVDQYLYGKKPSERDLEEIKALVASFPENRADLRSLVETLFPVYYKGRHSFITSHIENGKQIASFLNINATHTNFCHEFLNQLDKRGLLDSLPDILSKFP